ncbi:MAG TPA: 30S ribosomal protein S16 [Myxococcota bacterium]|nr:30S ribosomal protein S16 [Myxococcota bacterium]
MVKVRLYRTGARGKPSYRIVVMDQRKKRQGRVLELLGTYDPRGTGGIQYSAAALEKWVELGAQVSDTVRTLIVRHKRAAAAAPSA